MSCPICDNKGPNCDCSADAVRFHGEVQKLCEEVKFLQADKDMILDQKHLAEKERDAALFHKEICRRALEEIVYRVTGGDYKDGRRSVYDLAADALKQISGKPVYLCGKNGCRGELVETSAVSTKCVECGNELLSG